MIYLSLFQRSSKLCQRAFVSLSRAQPSLRSPFLLSNLVRGRSSSSNTIKGPHTPLLPSIARGVIATGVGLGLLNSFTPKVDCDAPVKLNSTVNHQSSKDFPPPPNSSVSIYELGFGTVVGICAGVFVKKGAKAVAWFLGGVFVLLQYLGSVSVAHTDWKMVSNKFETLFCSTDIQGIKRPPNVISLWRWLVDFLTADFQPRASFIAGFALGLRIG